MFLGGAFDMFSSSQVVSSFPTIKNIKSVIG